MKKKAKDEQRESEVFLLSFIGERVMILTDFVLTAATDGEESSLVEYSTGQPLVVEGYMLDSDYNYVYVGSTAEQVSNAVRKDRIVFIQLVEERDVLGEILNNLGSKNKREMN